MNVPTPQQSLLIMRKVRSSKWKYFGFCMVGFLVGISLYLVSYPPSNLPFPFNESMTRIKTYVGLFLAIAYGPFVIFFGICLFTRIWERICDWNIKKIQDKFSLPTDQDDGIDG